jgi:putative ABC transport system permease protein
VLKTLGFGSRLVMSLILAEAVLLGILGGVVGLGLSSLMIKALPSIPYIGDAVRAFPNLGLSLPVGALGFGVAVALGLLAGIVPAWNAYRSKITDMLRTV